MLGNVALRDARPAVIVCPDCRRHLMEVVDVRWAMATLEFVFQCAGCDAQLTRAIAGDTPVFKSRASAHLQSLEIFRFDPDGDGRDRNGAPADRGLRSDRPTPSATPASAR